MASTSVDQDIQRIETGLRQLKVEYDQFFAGALDRQPFELRKEIEQLLGHWTRSPINNYATRFHLNTLVSRFNSMSELWGRQIRCQEEGGSPATRRRERGDAPAVDTLYRTRVTGTETDEGRFRELHRAYVDANRRLAHKTGKVDYTDFYQKLTRQARTIRQKSGCGSVEFRLFFDGGKVRLKARPSGRQAGPPDALTASEPAR